MNYAEITAAPERNAYRALASEWHDMNEAGCCDGTGRFCEASGNWARGYLAAIADAENQAVPVDDALIARAESALRDNYPSPHLRLLGELLEQVKRLKQSRE